MSSSSDAASSSSSSSSGRNSSDWPSRALFGVSPSSSTCSLGHALSTSFVLAPASAPRTRRESALPIYVDSPPPAYSSRPSRTITVTQAAFESLSSGSSSARTLEDALALSIDAEIVARQQRREAEIRARLEPVLFPPPRSLVEVVGGLFGWRKGSKRASSPAPVTIDDLDEDERVVAQKMVDEYIARVDQMGY